MNAKTDTDTEDRQPIRRSDEELREEFPDASDTDLEIIRWAIHEE